MEECVETECKGLCVCVCGCALGDRCGAEGGLLASAPHTPRSPET